MSDRIERELTDAERNYILSITSDDISMTLITDLFVKTDPSVPARFMVNDYFKLPTDRFNTKKEVYTTIGIYLVNLHLIQPKFSDLFGYINKPFDGSVINMIEDKISDAVYNDKKSTSDLADYYNRIQWLGGNDKMSLLTPTITPALLKPPPGLIEKKKELFEKYKDELSPDNPNNAMVASKIEKELVSDAEKYLKTQDGYENFASKSKINIGNNYKTMNIMKGPLRSTYDGKYRVNESEYNTGITKSEYSSLADSSVLGAYSRAVNTAKGGYQGKLTNQSLSVVKAGPKNSDCGTTKYLKVKIYKSMKNDYLNRYIWDKGKLIELTNDNIDEYIDTEVNMRSPLYCKMAEPCYCNICIGNQPYLLGLESFGLAIQRISNKLTTLSMKKFHDLTVKTKKIDCDTLFEFE